MLSEELRNLARWMRARHTLRPLIDRPVDVIAFDHVVTVLDELAEEARRLEDQTRLTGEERAERVAVEGIQ